LTGNTAAPRCCHKGYSRAGRIDRHRIYAATLKGFANSSTEPLGLLRGIRLYQFNGETRKQAAHIAGAMLSRHIQQQPLFGV
jgi:hypothetical protein